MITTIKTAATKNSLTLAEVKEHLRLELSEVTENDSLLTLIRTSEKIAQDYTGRKFISQTIYYYLPEWPSSDYIRLPYGNLQTIDRITYWDSNESSSAFAATYWYSDTDSDPGRAVLRYGEEWPTATLDSRNPIRVQYICGYGKDPSSVPEPIRQAMKIIIGNLYVNRESGEIPQVSKTLLKDYRLFWSF